MFKDLYNYPLDFTLLDSSPFCYSLASFGWRLIFVCPCIRLFFSQSWFLIKK